MIADISDPTPPLKGPPCEVCNALAMIDPVEADALRGLLANRAWRYSELSYRLKEDPDTPLDLSPQSLSRHARGRCAAGERLR